MFDLLSGLKIVDLTTIVLGPYATQFLGDFGADVIKVESPDGDLFRAVRPGRTRDIGVGFMNFNRNKRSIVIDLKKPAGQSVLHRLVKDADVLVHNMRSKSAAHLGASYDELSAINPQLVYCFAPGFGDGGPDRDSPAYDDIIQARSGLANLNSDESGAPQFVRTIACDKVVGLHLAVAVLGGVVRRLQSGKGTLIEVPMLESMSAFLLAEHMAGHALVPPEGELGYDRVMSTDRRPYPTKDGYIAILPYSTKHWIRFFTVGQREDLANDPRVLDPAQRSENVDDLYQEIAQLAKTKTTDQWMKLLAEQDIPCSPVNSLGDLFDDPHLQAVEMFQRHCDERLGEIQQVRSPFNVDGSTDNASETSSIAPGLGEHSKEILDEVGYSDQEVTKLIENGIVA